MVTLLRQYCTWQCSQAFPSGSIVPDVGLNGCSRQHEDTGDAIPAPESMPLLPIRFPRWIRNSAGVYRYRDAPNGEIRSSLPADLDAVIQRSTIRIRCCSPEGTNRPGRKRPMRTRRRSLQSTGTDQSSTAGNTLGLQLHVHSRDERGLWC